MSDYLVGGGDGFRTQLYLGKIGTGILMALTISGLGVWQLIDVMLIPVGWTEAGSM